MLVVYPFFTGDQDQALKNARWIAELGGCETHDIFVLSDRRCPMELVKEVVKQFTGKFNIVQHRWTKADIDGWPEGANHMFTYTTALIQHEPKWQYFLWLEPDAIPISPGWLDALEAEHKRGMAVGKFFTGERVDLGEKRPDVPVHMSGVGIYQNPIYLHAGEAFRAHEVAWDIAAKDQILPFCHFTKLIQHYWKHGTFTHLNEIRLETVLFHSSKDGSLIDLLRKEAAPEITAVAAEPTTALEGVSREEIGTRPAQPLIKKLRDGTWILENDAISGQAMEAGRIDFDPLIPHIIQLIRPGDTVVDVGAFIGDHTVAYSNAVGKAGKVFAYEPNPEAFKCLVHNTAGMGNVFGFCHALGAQDGIAGLVGEWPSNFASHFISHNNHEGGPVVKVWRLDKDLPLFGQCDLIKIDVEGYELNMLKGAQQIIEKFHPKLVIEINEPALKRQDTVPNDILEWLGLHGYNDVSVLHRHGPSVPFYDILAIAKQPPEISAASGLPTADESPVVAPPVAAPHNLVGAPTIKQEIEWHIGVLKSFCESAPQTKAVVMQKLVYAGLRLPNKKTKHAKPKTHKQTNGSSGATA